jgi:uncharacterized protein (UPF0335 family)
MSTGEDYVNTLHPEHPQCPFVSKETCVNRTRASRWVVGVFFGVLGVFLALVVYAAGQATEASRSYTDVVERFAEHKREVESRVVDVHTEFKTHQAEQRASERAIIDKLDEVKDELAAQRKEQRALLEKILELQIQVAKKNGTPIPK